MSEIKTVSLEQLTPNMVILAYTHFSEAYKSMDEATTNFIKKNFVGTEVRVIRDSKTIECPINQVLPKDTVCKIYNFPKQLEKRTLVSSGLINALKKRGFLEFEVRTKVTKRDGVKSEDYKKAVAKAGKLVEKVKEGVKKREGASDAIEDSLDATRRTGKVQTSDIKAYVDEIVRSSSTDAIQAIGSLKRSDQTYAHCVDVAAIFHNAYYKICQKKGKAPAFSDEEESMFAGFVHDFGKSKIPKDILDSTVRFERDSKEMKLMQSHPVMSAELLASMNMKDIIVNMAHYHHVKYDKTIRSSYPKGVSIDDLMYESKLLCVVDVYQALIGRRSYKKSWAPGAAMRYIDSLAGTEFDPDTWDDFVDVMGVYPNSSLVRLSDESLAYVMEQSDNDPEKPKVVVVKDADGNMVSNHELIDLEREKDLEIEEDVDHEEEFGSNALDVFMSIKFS